MTSNIFTSSNGEYVNIPSRNEQKMSEDSFQTKKELYYIYLQEAKLRRELEFPIDDEKPSPLRTYQRLEHEIAERRKFFSFNGQATARCKSLPSICNPGLITQKQPSSTASKGETTAISIPSIKEPSFKTQATSNWQKLAQSLPTFSESKISASPGLRKSSSCAGDDAARTAKHRPSIRRTKSELPRRSQQKWKITMHRRVPTVI